MHNHHCPDELLPSAQNLRRSSLGALGVAILLLVTAVLPAEYAIDPTGLGRALGLTQMGEVKRALQQTATPAVHAASAPAPAAAAHNAAAVPTQQHTVKLVLQPNEGTEVKLEMPQGAKVRFAWSTTGGGLYYDTHGDPYGAAQDFYHGYEKGRDAAQQEGELVAAFDGRHGWYWRNSGSQPVTLTLQTQGEYITIEQML